MNNTLNMGQDRRGTLRVHLRSHGSLITAEGGHPAHLLNLSESGALAAVLDDHQVSDGEPVALDVELPGGEIARIEGHVAHVKEHLIGLDCTPATDKDMAAIAAFTAQVGDSQTLC